MDDEVAVRSLVADDLDWIVDLAARRGEQRQSFAPRFWRRSSDSRRVHAKYLGSLIQDPEVTAMRTAHTFAFGMHQPGLVLIDDAAAEREEQWSTEAPALLRRIVGKSRVRFVCPVPERSRSALAVDLGLRVAETWWHRDLPDSRSASLEENLLQVPAVEGRLVTAPPVYAPGGPVLLVTEFRDLRALAQIEREAARCGAPVSVVAQLPEDDVRGAMLQKIGYRRTCDFYEGNLKAIHQNG